MVACVGGGSNAAGSFYSFYDDVKIELFAIEAAGQGLKSGRSAATSFLGLPGVLHGSMTLLLQDEFGQVTEPHSISAVIIPDMSLEIYDRFYSVYFEKNSVSPCFLITLKTPKDRIRKMSERSKNSFVYLVSSNATTGSTISFSVDELPNYNAIKEICGETPLFIGFGVDSYEKVKLVQGLADGAIIGSAYLKALSENKHHKFLNKLSDL